MDRHTCKLCFRHFSNGRALGGHMRSHAASATIAATQKPKLPLEYSPSPSPSLSPSPSSCSSASRGDLGCFQQVAQVREHGGAAALAADGEVVVGAEEAKQLAFYGLRENPKKSFRLVDPAFSSTFAAAEYVAGGGGGGGGGGSSVMLQDWESETESSKPLSLRRRSKRRRRFSQLPPGKPEASFEPEPVSSVSDTSPEEDVARCLMMLSRDVWTTVGRDELVEEEGEEEEEEEEEDEDDEQPSDDSEEKRAAVARSRKGGRSRYQCGTCKKVFRSYQALGGHRASHKKIRACVPPPPPPSEGPSPVVVFAEEEKGRRAKFGIQILDADSEVNAGIAAAERKIHQCPVCFRVFSSGQALGGHKRSHLGYSSAATNPSTVQAPIISTTAAAAAAASSSDHVSGTTKLAGESMIDLNLPAPMDEEVELCSFR